MSVSAVLDTNVIVAALLSKNDDAATVKILDAAMDGRITPLYHEDILTEYAEVLHRQKFHFREETIQKVFTAIRYYGREIFPVSTGKTLLDEDDQIFYDVAVRGRAYLVTGNLRHYPPENFIVSPAQMALLIDVP